MTSSVSVPMKRAPIFSIHSVAGNPIGMPTASRNVRIHSRLPIVIGERVTSSLLRALRSTRPRDE